MQTPIQTALSVTCSAVLLLGIRPSAPILPAPAAALPVTTPLYADGSVNCDGADDLSYEVGTLLLRPVEEGVYFQVNLTHAARSWSYYVELSLNGTCSGSQLFKGFHTDKSGSGVFRGVYALPPGCSYQVFVDVVSDPPGHVPPDPRHREIAPSSPMQITLQGGGDGTTLAFGKAAQGQVLPWREQGFTFVEEYSANYASVEIDGQALAQYVYSDPYEPGWQVVRLTRDGGGTFDAVSFDVIEHFGGYYWLRSDRGEGGYQPCGSNTWMLTGPEWSDITYLEILLNDPYGALSKLVTDNFVVRVPAD
jgi:hypothetical protein